LGAAVLCALTVALTPASVRAASPPVTEAAQLEYSVKAAYLFNLAKFVEWPADGVRNRGSVVIGVLGKDPFGSILDAMVRGKTVSGRPLLVRRLDDVSEAGDCHVVFVSSAERRNIDPILERLESSGVLTVSEVESFIEKGGMINFVLQDGSIKLDINLDAARKAGLDISSQLLKVARKVKYEDR
jgi:hypothetical protein